MLGYKFIQINLFVYIKHKNYFNAPHMSEQGRVVVILPSHKQHVTFTCLLKINVINYIAFLVSYFKFFVLQWM